MSTTFGVKVPLSQPGEYEMVEIAFRSGDIRFTNKLAKLLPDQTVVYPLDNTAQGIETIGDIKNAIKNNRR